MNSLLYLGDYLFGRSLVLYAYVMIPTFSLKISKNNASNAELNCPEYYDLKTPGKTNYNECNELKSISTLVNDSII